jgi:hypothetical protein
MDDLPMVLIWRNHPTVRSYMLTQHEISLEEHRNWFARVKEDKTRQQLIVLDGVDPLGFVQFKPVCQGGIADWGFYSRPGAPKGSGTKPSLSIKSWALQKKAACKSSNALPISTTRFFALACLPKTGKQSN